VPHFPSPSATFSFSVIWHAAGFAAAWPCFCLRFITSLFIYFFINRIKYNRLVVAAPLASSSSRIRQFVDVVRVIVGATRRGGQTMQPCAGRPTQRISSSSSSSSQQPAD